MDEILPMGEMDLLSARMSVITVDSFANGRDPDRVGRVSLMFRPGDHR